MKGSTMMRALLLVAALLAASAPALARKVETVTLDVKNMTCSLCPITVRKALEKVPGVESARVDYPTHSASVTFDADKTSTADLVKATTNAGYPSRPRS
jgi:mercuric ion binding protein